MSERASERASQSVRSFVRSFVRSPALASSDQGRLDLKKSECDEKEDDHGRDDDDDDDLKEGLWVEQ